MRCTLQPRDGVHTFLLVEADDPIGPCDDGLGLVDFNVTFSDQDFGDGDLGGDLARSSPISVSRPSTTKYICQASQMEQTVLIAQFDHRQPLTVEWAPASSVGETQR